MVKVVSSVFPTIRLRSCFHGARLSLLFLIYKNIRLGDCGFSLLESGITTESYGFAVEVMKIVAPFICTCLRTVNAYDDLIVDTLPRSQIFH
jgi:hypothetical protein